MTSAKTILFMDIDGVLNSLEWFSQMNANLKPGESFNNSILCPENVAIFNTIVKTLNADVVISSTWRKLMPWEDLLAHLKSQGVVANFIDKTPTVICGTRGEEIEAWLKNNPEVNVYICLDDDMNLQQHGFKHLLTQWEAGLQPEDVNRAIEIVTRQLSEI